MRACVASFFLILAPFACDALSSEKVLKTHYDQWPWEQSTAPKLDNPEITATEAAKVNHEELPPSEEDEGMTKKDGCECGFQCAMIHDGSKCYESCCSDDPLGKIGIATSKARQDKTVDGCNCNFGCPLWNDGSQCYPKCCSNDIFGIKIPDVNPEDEKADEAKAVEAKKKWEEREAAKAKKRETCDCDFWCGPVDDHTDCYKPCCL